MFSACTCCSFGAGPPGGRLIITYQRRASEMNRPTANLNDRVPSAGQLAVIAAALAHQSPATSPYPDDTKFANVKRCRKYTESDQKAFEKRVAKRRAKKGYR